MTAYTEENDVRSISKKQVCNVRSQSGITQLDREMINRRSASIRTSHCSLRFLVSVTSLSIGRMSVSSSRK